MRLDMPERILAIKLADLGDMLVTEPALRSLRAGHPGIEIDVLTTPAAAQLLPLLDPALNVLQFEKHAFDNLSAVARGSGPAKLFAFGRRLRRRRYTKVAIFHHLTTPAGALKFRALAAATGSPVVAGLDNGRGEFLSHPALDLGFGTKHAVEYMLDVARQIGGVEVDPAPRVRTPEDDLPGYMRFHEPFALVFPLTGPFAPGRDWPGASFVELSSLLHTAGLQPVISGASEATPIASEIRSRVPSAIDITGRTTIAQLAQIMKRASVVVSGDSFPGHLAAALGAPVVSIFGPSNHRAWAPFGAVDRQTHHGETALIARNPVPCSPCLYTGYRLGRRFGCPSRTCLNTLRAEDVMHSVHTALRNRP